mmetsp:Transcript_74974/g.124879  ORF Transcript_74974/g.124879 Transcript_74974/m.124879 type:complete len:115 (+) Transcript_74974:189-533(+)
MQLLCPNLHSKPDFHFASRIRHHCTAFLCLRSKNNTNDSDDDNNNFWHCYIGAHFNLANGPRMLSRPKVFLLNTCCPQRVSTYIAASNQNAPLIGAQEHPMCSRLSPVYFAVPS